MVITQDLTDYLKQKVDVGRGWTSICHQKPSRTGEIMCILCITGNAGQHHLKKISVIDINLSFLEFEMTLSNTNFMLSRHQSGDSVDR